jgi:hypothetical protein
MTHVVPHETPPQVDADAGPIRAAAQGTSR